MKNKKKLFGKTMGLIAALVLCFGMTVLAAPSVTGDTELTVQKDKIVSASYKITNDDSIESVKLTLSYDKSDLTYMSGSGGDNFSGSGGNGLVELSSNPGSKAATFGVKFKGLTDGTSEVTVSSCTITVNGKEIDALSGVSLEEEEEDQTVEHPVSVENLEGNVSFDHVHFGYNADRIIVNDFSAEVKEGQKIAIVGPTGAGKTTMIKLLMRFYDVNSGAIKIDGHDVRDFNRSELREMFGMVLQDTWLFNGSIWDNIKYGKLDATDEEVIQAAKAAHVHQFVKTLPGGYDMELNEEANNVSQGQKQLLTIARAILADPKILILDEATSSVDTRTEVLIQKAMDNLMKGRTSFVIAHRLSTIRDADMILVMKDGDIVEQGNHEELLAKGGFYADLYNSQFEKTTEVA